MPSVAHSAQTPADGIHVQHRWAVANEAARLALTVSAADVGGVCFQTQDKLLYDLIQVSPSIVWQRRATNAELAALAGIGNLEADRHYSHTQGVPSAVWVVVHNLGKRPAVTVIDSAGDEVEGEVRHDSINQLTITFGGAFSGTALCN